MGINRDFCCLRRDACLVGERNVGLIAWNRVLGCLLERRQKIIGLHCIVFIAKISCKITYDQGKIKACKDG